jgi:hypothetical protein
MVAKTRLRKGLHEYWVRGVKGDKTKVTARNIQQAVNKVSRMYPRANVLGVERVSHTGKEYETTWINR